MPALERLHQKLKDKGLIVVAISADDAETSAEVRAFADRHGLTFPILLDPKKTAAQALGAEGFPETFFYSKTGDLLPFFDARSGKNQQKVISDRPWDAPRFVKQVEKLLEQTPRPAGDKN
jgi:peroxiredoxin